MKENKTVKNGPASAPENSPVEIKQPLTLRPLTVYNPRTGQPVTSNKPTLVERCAEIAQKLRGTGQTVTVGVPFNQFDIRTANAAYEKRNRPLSEPYVVEIAQRFSSEPCRFVETYPTLTWDWNGVQVNGGHTMAGFMRSTRQSWIFICVLGVDPAIDLHIDVLKRRDAVAQAFYLPGESVYAGIKGDEDGQLRKSYMATAGYIFGIGVDYEVFPAERTSFTCAKSNIVQEIYGVKVLRACNASFMFVRRLLNEQKKKLKMREDGIFERANTAVYNAPMVALHLAGYERLIKPITFGGTENENLLRAHNVLLEKIGSPDYTALRDEQERVQMTLEILACVYAHVRRVEVPDLLPRFEYQKAKGKNEKILTKVWHRHSRAAKAADKEVRHRIVTHFWNKILANI